MNDRTRWSGGREWLATGLVVALVAAGVTRAQEAGFRKPAREARMTADGTLWLDAEDFADYGGWTLDTQFVHLMGSGYLIAAGIGLPVTDATTTVTIDKGGDYRVWVRARNWVKAYSPGVFSLRIGGQELKHRFGGADTDEWTWEAGGAVRLDAGDVKLAIHDLTGYYGRCDAIVLTRNGDCRPPADTQAVIRERARLTGVSLEPKDGGAFDIIVVGGGSAGGTAALAGAREGARTALIQNRPVLGGNCSRECGVGLNGAGTHHRNARETGLPEEVGRLKAYRGHGFYGDAFLELAREQENLTLCLNQHAFAVEMDGADRIAAVKAVDTLTGEITRYTATQFIDCTGDGWLGYFAGAKFRLGREARDEFGESLAPESADSITMSGCLMGGMCGFRAVKTEHPVPYAAPPWAHKMKSHEAFGRRVRRVTGGEWWMEHPGTVDDLWQAEYARDELIRITYGYWDYVKNESELQDEARCYRLEVVPLMDAKRETRRLIGDYILKQQDVESARVFPDRVSYGGWNIDVHHPEGIFSGKVGPFDYDPRVPIYTIPYRCLYSTNIVNLSMAGRCCSVTHVALGTVRVQSTLATLGQAAGTAAAMCVHGGICPREVYREHIHELQQRLLKNDQTIPEVFNEDPADLARNAAVDASSTATFTEFAKADVRPLDAHPLNMERGINIPATPASPLRAIHLRLISENASPTPVTLYVADGAGDGNAPATKAADAPLRVKADVRPNAAQWVTFALDRPVGAHGLWVWLGKTPGVSWSLMDRGPTGAYRAYRGNDWTVVANQCYAFYTTPDLKLPTTFRVANVNNGRVRVADGESNMWASDPREPLPQWVRLSFPQPTKVNCVHLTFDTDVNAKGHHEKFPRTIVRDYEIAIQVADTWRTVVREKDNYRRFRVHRFPEAAATALRVTALATGGDRSARIYGIRAYDE